MLVLPALALLAIACVGRVLLRSWLAPGAIFALLWALNVALTLVGRPGDVPLLGAAWITLACFAVAAGDALGRLGCVRLLAAGPAGGPADRPPPAIVPAIVATTALGFAYLALRTILIGPYWSFDLDAPDLPTYTKPLFAAQFAAPAFGGIYLASGPTRRRAYAAVALLPSVATTLISTRRTLVILGVLFWLGGYFSWRVLRDGGRTPLLTVRRLALVGLSAAALVAFVFACALFRMQLTGEESSLYEVGSQFGGSLSAEGLAGQWSRVRHLFLDYVPVFSTWLDDNWDHLPETTFGAWTFSGPCELLGLGRRLYIDDFEVEPGVWTNVYTLFYSLVVDFTPVGAILFLFLVGLLAGVAYATIAAGRLAMIPALIAVYVFLWYSPVGSAFRYNTVVFALVYVALYVTYLASVGRVPEVARRPVVAARFARRR